MALTLTARVFRSLLWNVLCLVGLALPGALLAGALQQLVSPVEWSLSSAIETQRGDVLLTFGFWYLVLTWPLLIGGCIHQLLIIGLRRLATRSSLRVWVLVTSPVVLSGFFIVDGTGNALLSPRAVLPIGVLIALYGALVAHSSAGTVDPRIEAETVPTGGDEPRR